MCRRGAPATQVRIQYGGSVNRGEHRRAARCPDVDGPLVGGASLDAAAFVDIVRAAARGRAVSLVASRDGPEAERRTLPC